MKQLILALALVAPGFPALAQDLPTPESYGIKTWDAPPVIQRREGLPAGAVTVCPEGCDYTHLHMLPKNFSKPVDVGLYGGDDPARPLTYRGFSMQKRGYFRIHGYGAVRPVIVSTVAMPLTDQEKAQGWTVDTFEPESEAVIYCTHGCELYDINFLGRSRTGKVAGVVKVALSWVKARLRDHQGTTKLERLGFRQAKMCLFQSGGRVFASDIDCADYASDGQNHGVYATAGTEFNIRRSYFRPPALNDGNLIRCGTKICTIVDNYFGGPGARYSGLNFSYRVPQRIVITGNVIHGGAGHWSLMRSDNLTNSCCPLPKPPAKPAESFVMRDNVLVLYRAYDPGAPGSSGAVWRADRPLEAHFATVDIANNRLVNGHDGRPVTPQVAQAISDGNGWQRLPMPGFVLAP